MIVNSGSIGKVFTALFLAALVTIPSTANAQATYLLIDSIAGGSVDNTHVGWINVMSLDYGVDGPTALTKVANFHPIKITKEMDVATIPIMEAAASGRVFQSATIDVTSSTSGGARTTFYQIALKNVRVSSYSVSIEGDDGGVPMESFELHYGELSLTYTDTGKDGLPKGQITYGWQVDSSRQQ